MDYLVAIIIIGGLGVMAYLIVSSGKKKEGKRTQVAAARGWNYVAEHKKVDVNNPAEDSNVYYRVNGFTASGHKWEMTGRKQAGYESDSGVKTEFEASAELVTDKPFEDYFLIMPQAGLTLPAFARAEIFSRLSFPADTPQAESSKLPAGLGDKYAVYTKSPEGLDFLGKAAVLIDQWQEKHSGLKKALIIAGGPQGIKVRTEMDVSKETDMELFIDTALSLIS